MAQVKPMQAVVRFEIGQEDYYSDDSSSSTDQDELRVPEVLATERRSATTTTAKDRVSRKDGKDGLNPSRHDSGAVTSGTPSSTASACSRLSPALNVERVSPSPPTSQPPPQSTATRKRSFRRHSTSARSSTSERASSQVLDSGGLSSTPTSPAIDTGTTATTHEIEHHQRDGSRRRSFKRSDTLGQYRIEKTLGQGAFAKVKLATHIASGTQVAIKIVYKHDIEVDYVRDNLHREARLLKLVDHPNVLKLFEIIETDELYCLVTELAIGGEILNYIVAHKSLSEREARKFVRQLIQAVDHIHQHGIVHRDIKTENLLLDRNMDLKLVDFGLGNTLGEGEDRFKTQCGSPAYTAPELLGGKPYTDSVDIWSIGINAYAMLTGKLPFASDNITVLHALILDQQFKIPDTFSPECIDFFRRTLVAKPSGRITMEGLRNHPWICQDDLGPLPAASRRIEHDESWLDRKVVAHVAKTHNCNAEEVTRAVLDNQCNDIMAAYYLHLERFHESGSLDAPKPISKPLRRSCTEGNLTVAKARETAKRLTKVSQPPSRSPSTTAYDSRAAVPRRKSFSSRQGISSPKPPKSVLSANTSVSPRRTGAQKSRRRRTTSGRELSASSLDPVDDAGSQELGESDDGCATNDFDEIRDKQDNVTNIDDPGDGAGDIVAPQFPGSRRRATLDVVNRQTLMRHAGASSIGGTNGSGSGADEGCNPSISRSQRSVTLTPPPRTDTLSRRMSTNGIAGAIAVISDSDADATVVRYGDGTTSPGSAPSDRWYERKDRKDVVSPANLASGRLGTATSAVEDVKGDRTNVGTSVRKGSKPRRSTMLPNIRRTESTGALRRLPTHQQQQPSPSFMAASVPRPRETEARSACSSAKCMPTSSSSNSSSSSRTRLSTRRASMSGALKPAVRRNTSLGRLSSAKSSADVYVRTMRVPVGKRNIAPSSTASELFDRVQQVAIELSFKFTVCVDGGLSITCRTPHLTIEVEVIRLAGLDVHGIHFQRISGDVQLYQQACSTILEFMNLS
eukprot:m.269400 g.269400  ORF g.269400 m.269400 type:complete len:1023 (-) comp15671_c1_seq1:141-3209(-)